MSAATHTPGPWTQTRWGNRSFEIQGGGHSIAIVGRVQDKRLHYLAGVRSKAAKNGEPAHQAEQEAQRIEAYDLLPDAKLIAAAPALADALEALLASVAEMTAPPTAGHPLTRTDRDELEGREREAIEGARTALRAAGRIP